MTFYIRILTIAAIVVLGTLAGFPKDFVVVIDAGHGGHDYGAIGVKTNEKTINLGVALKLGDLIKKAHDDVKVVYTRDGDYYKKLQERAQIANKAGGDLFISIHTNSVDKKNRNRTTIHGAATYTLGLHKSAANFEVAKRENSVIMLEDDFTTTYQGFDPNSTESYIIFELSQNKHIDQSINFASRVQQELSSTASRKDNGVRQAGFLVLAATGMPAVLVELDFICNPECEKYMASQTGQSRMARSIFDAFTKYKISIDKASGKKVKEIKLPDEEPAVEEPAVETVAESIPAADADPKDKSVFKIQIMASDVELKPGARELKGVKDYSSYYDGGLYKYTIGCYNTKAEAQRALPQVRKVHQQAFVIEMRDGKRVK